MKKPIILFFAILILTDCTGVTIETKIETDTAKENKYSPSFTEGKNGVFIVDEITYNGTVSIQYFDDKRQEQFSIICQQNEPFTLLQVTFANEDQLKGSLQPVGSFYTIRSGKAHISLSGAKIGTNEFVTRNESSGSIAVANHKVIIKDLELFATNGAVKKVNAELPF